MKRFFFHYLTIDKHRMNELSETMDDAEVKSLRYFILYFRLNYTIVFPFDIISFVLLNTSA